MLFSHLLVHNVGYITHARSSPHMPPRSTIEILSSLIRRRPQLRVESLALIVSLFFVVFCNRLFWEDALAAYNFSKTSTWLVAGALFVSLTSLHFLLLALVLNRWIIKPLLSLLILATAFAVYFVSRYHVYLDPSMLRNVLATDVHEASDLMTWALLPHLLLYAVLPIAFIYRCQLHLDPPGKAALRRGAALLLALLTSAGAIMVIYQDLASMMRNNKELRYLITPGNFLYSMTRIAHGTTQIVKGPRLAVGSDAMLGGNWKEHKKPVLLVFVLGETVRAANWGLSGYARQTTPELAAEGVTNFASVTSCGSNTEVSLPCIFSQQGRRHYDETRIRNSETLLDVVARTGLKVTWIDNQSGCKGVCDGVGETRPNLAALPSLCDGERCFDEALLKTLEQLVASHSESRFVVMHPMGNHGPAYYKRYPEAFKRFTPACENSDLAQCSREEIVNAYDNAIAYTDHVLAETIRFLKKQKTHDAALIYVSDHGESLGENGLFLHGIPYAIAPDEQLKVPMVMWLGEGYARRFSLDTACVNKRAALPAEHDNLFHTVLGMLDIKTTAYSAEMDLSAACRPTP